MKIIHLSDLHLGKMLYDFSLLEDQAYILQQILAIVDEQAPDAVLISGDVYDRSIAPVEALRLFEDFLIQLAHRRVQVYVIGGNHDSADRLSFGAPLMEQTGVHITGNYEGRVAHWTLFDEHGAVTFYLLPFVKPLQVRRFFPDEAIESWTDALRAVLNAASPDPAHRNVLLAHQFVTGAVRSDSEEISVGGADNVDAGVFDAFDYVALGHIHAPQSVARPEVRYCGTPLKYSFSEVDQQKSVTVVELGEKGTIDIRTVPLTPKRELRELRGTYLELSSRAFYEELSREDYYRIILTDEEDPIDALAKLRLIYPRLMRLDYDNRRTRAQADFSDMEKAPELSPPELFEELYRMQNGADFSPKQREYTRATMEEIWRAEYETC
ncbi:MAG: exonuclease SbcCD subunit D [Ndongobacter sp.]|nr:exonuclease SbcCD subunit D [Ndongobacter sp.]